MSTPNFNYCSQQMKLFLRDFLQDIRSLIFQIKTHIYKLTDLCPDSLPLQPAKVYPNFHSILKNCTQTGEDLKRIHYMLQGYSQNKRSKIRTKSPPANFFKPSSIKTQNLQNNITFQNCLGNSIISSCKTNQFVFDHMTFNTENDLNIINSSKSSPKVHLRNKTQNTFNKLGSDKEATEVQTHVENLTKRTNFTSMRKKSPGVCYRGHVSSLNEQISRFSLLNPGITFTQKESQISLNQHKQHQRNESLSFTFQRAPTTESSVLKSQRCPKILDQTARRNSKCLDIIKSIRKELSK